MIGLLERFIFALFLRFRVPDITGNFFDEFLALARDKKQCQAEKCSGSSNPIKNLIISFLDWYERLVLYLPQ